MLVKCLCFIISLGKFYPRSQFFTYQQLRNESRWIPFPRKNSNIHKFVCKQQVSVEVGGIWVGEATVCLCALSSSRRNSSQVMLPQLLILLRKMRTFLIFRMLNFSRLITWANLSSETKKQLHSNVLPTRSQKHSW